MAGRPGGPAALTINHLTALNGGVQHEPAPFSGRSLELQFSTAAMQYYWCRHGGLLDSA